MKDKLAIFGGKKIRSTPMPLRRALGSEELEFINEVTSHYVTTGEDLPYLGIYNSMFAESFVNFMGGRGYASPVTSGTAAVYIAFAALNLPKGSRVLVSPVTDSGPIAALLNLGMIPILVDAAHGSWNISLDTFKNSDVKNCAAILLTHAGGEPTKDTEEIVKLAKSYGMFVVEDAAQAPGAKISNRCVGTFGDISAFSTMYRKSVISGSQGGLVYTRCPELGRQILAHLDKGKPIWRHDLDLRDPNHCLFPGLNWMQDEISCGIGIASLAKLPGVISERYKWTKKFVKSLSSKSKVCKSYDLHEGFSVFFFSIFVDTSLISCDKITFAKAVQAEGIGLGEHYGCVISSWNWLHKTLGFEQSTPNAEFTRDNSFNLYVNEKYGDDEINDIVEAIVKVEKYYLK
jgi:dTDP-4-amino-4,6-dideoxygalactose transaminase